MAVHAVAWTHVKIVQSFPHFYYTPFFPYFLPLETRFQKKARTAVERTAFFLVFGKCPRRRVVLAGDGRGSGVYGV